MHNSKGSKKPDSTTIFVSLSLALLVLFSYLNAVSLPSERLLKKALPSQNPDAEAPSLSKVAFPQALKKLVVFSSKKNSITSEQLFAESFLLIDKRQLSQTAESNRSYQEELFSWLETAASANLNFEITCFLPVVPTPASVLVPGLNDLQHRCTELFRDVPTTAVKERMRFYSRQTPARVAEKLAERSLSENDAVLITLSNSAAPI